MARAWWGHRSRPKNDKTTRGGGGAGVGGMDLVRHVARGMFGRPAVKKKVGARHQGVNLGRTKTRVSA